MKDKISISLALSGGGARGSFHLGFIQALQENGVEIKAISGSSAGALVGGAVACGIEPKEVMEILKSQEFRELFKFNWFRKSIFRVDYASNVTNKLFGVGDISNTKIPFYACVADMESHEVFYANRGDGKSLISASCSIVPVFEPYIYDGRILADGGILDMMPTTPLTKYDYPILGINLMPSKMPKKHSFWNLTKRTLNLILTSNIAHDIKRCKWYIAPKEITKIRIFSLNNLQTGYDLGYKHGVEWCEENLTTI